MNPLAIVSIRDAEGGFELKSGKRGGSLCRFRCKRQLMSSAEKQTLVMLVKVSQVATVGLWGHMMG